MDNRKIIILIVVLGIVGYLVYSYMKNGSLFGVSMTSPVMQTSTAKIVYPTGSIQGGVVGPPISTSPLVVNSSGPAPMVVRKSVDDSFFNPFMFGLNVPSVKKSVGNTPEIGSTDIIQYAPVQGRQYIV